MEIQVQNFCTVLPACGDSDSKPYHVPFNIFDRFAPDMRVPIIFFFAPPTPPNPDIIQGLRKVLPYFPTLAGEIARDHRGRPHIFVGGDRRRQGVLVVEATVNSDLSDHLPLKPSPDYLRLHPPVREGAAAHLLQIQLNRFNCGGLAIGATSHHWVADGRSMSAFFVALGQVVRGAPIDPMPVHDHSWLKPRNPPKPEFDHWGTDFLPITPQGLESFTPNLKSTDPTRISSMLLRYSSEFIATELTSQTRKKYTKFQIVLADVWRKMTAARELGGSETTTLRISVNGRTRLRSPPVPKEFFGNVVLHASPRSNVELLLQGTLEDAATIVREAVAAVDERYFRSFIDFGALHEEEELVPLLDNEGNVLSPCAEVDSWMFEFREIDLGGGGRLCGLSPTWVPVEGIVVFLPSADDDGGVDVFLTLLNEHAARMAEISRALLC